MYSYTHLFAFIYVYVYFFFKKNDKNQRAWGLFLESPETFRAYFG